MHLHDGGRSFFTDWKANRDSSSEEGQAPSSSFTDRERSAQEVLTGFHSGQGNSKISAQAETARLTVETVRAIETRQRRGGAPERALRTIASEKVVKQSLARQYSAQ